MQPNLIQALMAYGLRMLAEATGADAEKLITGRPDLAAATEVSWQAYEVALAGEQDRPPEAMLTCIFSLIETREDQRPEPQFYSAQPLALERAVLFPRARSEARQAGQKLWDDFAAEFQQIPPTGTPAAFETFYHLFYKYAWAVPCRYGEPGVSLFEQWKAVAALAFASGQGWGAGPAQDFTLIGGDIPGIQNFVYTITSKGAAKGLRGRSFFLQLLGDAVVRRVLADLGLSLANVIYDAGGNFMILGPAGDDAVQVLERILARVNTRLVEAIQGETALVLESDSVSTEDLFKSDRFKEVRKNFGQQVARAKSRPLRELADQWDTLFKPRGKGSRLSCAVCRIEVDKHNSKELERTGEVPEGTERPRICYLCDSFGQLARDIRHEPLWMRVVDKPITLGSEAEPKDGWTELLARMTGFEYAFSDQAPQASGTVLAINQLDFLQAKAHGVRLLANVTPAVTPDDLDYLRDEEKLDPKDMPHPEDIRSFTLLAHAAATAGAIERVGVLLMDVDGLGRIFSAGMPEMTLPRLSALSGALDRFFGGYLNKLVRDQAGNDLYIIYAGGDDLFIVGAWQHLPALAEAIRDEFKAFTGDHPRLSLSGGITLEGAKFPLYRAAERAGEAEHRAKDYTRPNGRKKDAFCFLDTVVGWEDWALVRDQTQELLWLIGEDEASRSKGKEERDKRLPRALLQVVQSIYQLYRSALQQARQRVRAQNQDRPAEKRLSLPDPQLFYGRWAWMRVYSLTRLAERGKEDLPEAPARIKELQKRIMQPDTVRYSGLAARWAEYLTRKVDDQGGRSGS